MRQKPSTRKERGSLRRAICGARVTATGIITRLQKIQTTQTVISFFLRWLSARRFAQSSRHSQGEQGFASSTAACFFKRLYPPNATSTSPAPIAEIKSAMAAPTIAPLVPGLRLFTRNVNRESSPGTRNIRPKQIKNAAAPLEGFVTQQF